MFAIVDIAGFQEKVSKGAKLKVPLLKAKKGDTVTFDQVYLLAKSDDDVEVGTPVVSGVAVMAKVIDHGKTDKVYFTKFKRRKRYLKMGSHRQDFTEIEITDIAAGKQTAAKEVQKKALNPKL